MFINDFTRLQEAYTAVANNLAAVQPGVTTETQDGRPGAMQEQCAPDQEQLQALAQLLGKLGDMCQQAADTGNHQLMDRVKQQLSSIRALKQQITAGLEENAHWRDQTSDEDLNELSQQTLKSYGSRAREQAQQAKKYATQGEYQDIAGRVLDRRNRGISRAQSREPQQMSESMVARLRDMINDASGVISEAEAWKRKEGKNKNGGLNDRGVASYRAANPGSKLQKAVTTPPSKLKAGSKAAGRRKSFCARMGGNKGPMKKPNGDPTRKALALRKWNCESVEQFGQLIEQGMTQLNQLLESSTKMSPKMPSVNQAINRYAPVPKTGRTAASQRRTPGAIDTPMKPYVDHMAQPVTKKDDMKVSTAHKK
jgi:hypothetical protein